MLQSVIQTSRGAERAQHVYAGEIISILDKRVEEAGNRKRQTVLLSATLHSRLSTLASLSLRDFDSIGFRVQVQHLGSGVSEGCHISVSGLVTDPTFIAKALALR